MEEKTKKKKTHLDWVDIDKIKFNIKNPRQRFSQKSIDKLARSIKKEGILVPLLVYKENDDEFVLLDGERRLRAARKINEKSVPVNIIKKPNDKDNVLKMFEIHTQREEWDPVSMAWSIRDLIEVINLGITPEEILKDSMEFNKLRKQVGLSHKKFKDCLIILTFPDDLQKRVFEKDLKTAYLTEMYPLLVAYKEFQSDIYNEIGREGIIRALIEKVDTKVIKTFTKFRILIKIVKAGEMGAPENIVKRISKDVLVNLEMKVDNAYDKTLKAVDIVNDIIIRCDELSQDFSAIPIEKVPDIEKLKKSLIELRKALDEALYRLGGDD